MGHSPQDHCAGMHWDPGEGSYNAWCNLVTSAQLSGFWESQEHEPGPHVKCGKLWNPRGWGEGTAERVQCSLSGNAVRKGRRWKMVTLGQAQEQGDSSSVWTGRVPDGLHAMAGAQGRDEQGPQNLSVPPTQPFHWVPGGKENPQE